MKIRKRVRLNTSFATKAISDRFPHFGATKIGDSGRHGNPHFSVFYTRLATQSGRYPLKDEDARPPAGESRSTGAHPASGQRQQHFPAEGHALEERTIRQAAVAPTAGRMPKAASETDGLPSSRGQTGSALSAPPRIPARRRRNGAPKRSSVTQKHRTSLPADELRIARDIGSAGDRLPVLARHAAERLPPRRRSRIPSSGRHETTDGPGSAQSGNIAIFILRNRLCSVQIAARCGIGEVVSPEEALSGKSTGTPAIAARLPRTSARHRHVSTCRPPEGGGLPKPAASDRTTIPPVRPRPTVLYRTRRRSRHFCRRASPSATQRTFHPSYRRTRTFDNRQTAPPSFAPSERKSSIREEGTAPPDTVSIRSGALPPSSPSARRFGLRFKQSGKNKSKPPGSVSSTAVEVPSEHAYSAASCNLEWQTTKTRQANESFAAASGEPLIRGKYENCND